MGTFDPIRDLQDMTGRVVTGATSGIGYATAEQLLRKGAKVYIAARNEEKGKKAIHKLVPEGLAPGHGTPVFHQLSLDDPVKAKASAEAFLKMESRLDVLVNNAGTFFSPYKVGALGCDNDMVVNQISPFVFTNVLLPLLKRTALDPDADVRIVNVASSVHGNPTKVQFNTRSDLNISYEGTWLAAMKRYALTKLANVLWTRELAKRLSVSVEDGGSNIIALALDPGMVKSEGNLVGLPSLFPWPISSLVSAMMQLVAVTSTQGAYNSSFAAAASVVRREAPEYHGSYLVPGQTIGKVAKVASDYKLAENLWELQISILKEEEII